jgi:hypothetical protein
MIIFLGLQRYYMSHAGRWIPHFYAVLKEGTPRSGGSGAVLSPVRSHDCAIEQLIPSPLENRLTTMFDAHGVGGLLDAGAESSIVRLQKGRKG